MTTRRAFSMIEMVLVLAIVGVVAAVALPRYDQSLAGYRAQTAARRLAADLSLARAEAKRASAARSIVFDAAAGAYQLPGVTGLDRPTDPYRVSLVADPYNARRVTVSLEDGGHTLTFDGYGHVSTGGRIVIDAGSRQQAVVIDAASGGVTLP